MKVLQKFAPVAAALALAAGLVAGIAGAANAADAGYPDKAPVAESLTEESFDAVAAEASSAASAFAKKAGKAGQAGDRAYGVPASVTAAQAILESGWGRSTLASKSNNYFGIKCVNKKPGPIAKSCKAYRTKEYVNGKPVYVTAYFRVYANMSDSFKDHALFLKSNSRYKACFDVKDNSSKFAQCLQSKGYATDPNYAKTLISLMKTYKLTQYDVR
ncbi:hypothetical protein Lfu02_24770 [Longispora fulva]|uniref:Flagellum-specific peptidoglycan hydrolase FlgJ n=1 Tax=Longispora fulva TaxID=619741 RepID=A0A8J7KSD7_9ACTN|nr:glucosaminidase domain-containing protein [Longispora fulva]MBG6139512.1 flagellum-specific peptidoglycan hydrolase FlgJ [Longispora fulva]GIG58105.1 hypothetical protein Lfu02_24770 [Longispora fulva]